MEALDRQLSLLVELVPGPALPQDALVVAEVEASQSVLGLCPPLRRDGVGHDELQGWEEDLEPSVLDLMRIEDLVVRILLAAVDPGRGETVVGPVVGPGEMVLAAQEVVHRSDRLPHGRV